MSQASPEYAVTVADHGAVRVLVLDRPAKLNAFTAAGYRVLTERLGDAEADPDVAVCVLAGRGRAFCAGVDMTEMGRPGGRTELGTAFDPLLERLATFSKPLVAAVHGAAVGFGATILLHCDIVVVEQGAHIKMPFVALGTCAEAGSSWLLPHRVGSQQAAWLVLSGTGIGAQEAVDMGLALRSVVPGRALAEALALAGPIAAHRVAALVANKQLLRHGWGATVIDTWEREKVAMMAMARQLGSFGWSAGEKPVTG